MIVTAKQIREAVKSVLAGTKRRAIRRAPADPVEFARKYHSVERVQFVAAMRCVACALLEPERAADTRGACENAHSESGKGTGFKAGYETVVPMCKRHHRRFDRWLPPFTDRELRAKIRGFAPQVQDLWAAHAARIGVAA